MMTTETKKDYKFDSRIMAIHKLRVNVKSIAAEARFIRKEAERCGACYSYTLDQHRRLYLRNEARLAHLALAFFRGRPYKSVESHLKNAEPVNPAKLLAKINKFPSSKDYNFVTTPVFTIDQIKQWLNA